MVFFCICGKKFNKEIYYKEHCKICKQFVKTDGTYEVTVLKDKLIGWKMFSDNLLHRCPNQKHFQLQHLLLMPPNTSFLDIGAHYGDTVCTFAVYAKNHNRKDIRFFAFEPNKDKCDHISNISKLNDLNITIFNNCVGNNNEKCSVLDNNLGGNASYKSDLNGNFKTIKLNDIKNIIEPIGYMHIDVEGWEDKVLNGAQSVLNNKNNKMMLFLEYWNDENQIKILEELKNIKYKRLEDYIENEEKNMVLKVNF